MKNTFISLLYVFPSCFPECCFCKRCVQEHFLCIGSAVTDRCMQYTFKNIFLKTIQLFFPSVDHCCFSKRVDEAKCFCTKMLFLGFKCSICKLLHLQQCSAVKTIFFSKDIEVLSELYTFKSSSICPTAFNIMEY